ncbi:MAG: hypothetical protein K6C34_04935 [Alphaproteobacteria bacterium]|nr:hypothetical protein [Alphaproteobacteria bacterium]
MFSDLKKIIFIVLGLLLSAIIKEESVTLPSDPMYIDGIGIGEGHYKKWQIRKKVNMAENGLLVVENTGALVGKIQGASVKVKVRHPTWKTGRTPKKAKIEISALIGEGDSARLIAQYEGSFAKIARMLIPFLCSDLIQDANLPNVGGWKGIFGVTSDDDDCIRLFSPSIAAYYNAQQTYTLVWDIADPVLNNSIDTSPNDPKKNFVYKMVVATLDPTDPTLPTYNSGTAPCGVETVGDEKVYHIPFGIGCKKPNEAVVYTPSVDIRGAGKVMLEGDNSYLREGTVYVRKGVEAVVTTPQSMPQSNITVVPHMDGGVSTLTFPNNLASETTFTMRSGTTLTVEDGGRVNVPRNVTLDLRAANVTIKAGAVMHIDGNVYL